MPWVDAHYRTLAAGPHRAISGKSSGGFGTMFTPMSLAWLCHRTAE